MSGKIFKRAIASVTLAALPIVGLAGNANASVRNVPSPYATKAMAIARSEIGKPYTEGRGHLGPNAFDCSGLVYYSFKHAGKNWSYMWTVPLYSYLSDHGDYVPYTKRLPGDIVTFGSWGGTYHVGIYIGVKWYEGKWRSMMIAAPHSGARVRIEPIYGNWDAGSAINYWRVK